MSKEEVLFELLQTIELNSGDDYHNVSTHEEFEDNVKSVKREFGFDYHEYKRKRNLEIVERIENEPVDRNNEVKRIKPNY